MFDNNILDKLPKDDEAKLNPTYKRYRVNHSTKLIFAITLVLGLGFYSYYIIDRKLSQQNFIRHNQMAAIKLVPSLLPNIEVLDPITQKSAFLREQTDGWTLLNLWATWCPPCQEEMPSLEKLSKELSGKLNIIALSVDEDQKPVEGFIKKNHPSFKVLWDKTGEISKLLGVSKYPETFLISPDGYLAYQFSGPRNWASPLALEYFNRYINNFI